VRHRVDDAAECIEVGEQDLPRSRHLGFAHVKRDRWSNNRSLLKQPLGSA
jgi:hypothetical protein